LGFILAAAFIVLTAPEVASGNAPLIPGLLLALIGFLLIANTVFKLNRQSILLLNFGFYLLVLGLLVLSYMSFSSGLFILFGSAGQGGIVLDGIIAQVLAAILMVKCVVLIVAGLFFILYAKTKDKELDEAYVEIYHKLVDKIRAR